MVGSQQPAAASGQQQQAVSQPADNRVVLRGVAVLYECSGGNHRLSEGGVGKGCVEIGVLGN